ncbi:MAG: hypothetical protein JWM28_4582, partial [Chitinophagaceae bacterium]|nr:hypothetical protein [Chitinophagaceae bacterium]
NQWPETRKADRLSNSLGWIFLVVLLPIINLAEAVNTKTMTATREGLHAADSASFALTWQTVMWIMSFLFMLSIGFYFKPSWKNLVTQKKTTAFTLLFLTWYILISNFISATWLTAKFSSQHLYWVNLIVLFFLLPRQTEPSFSDINNEPSSYSYTLLKWGLTALLVILLVSYLAVAMGPVNPNAQLRFG